jgi:hypothetical protein
MVGDIGFHTPPEPDYMHQTFRRFKRSVFVRPLQWRQERR